MNLEQFLLLPQKKMRDALECLNKNEKGIVLVVDEKKHLLGTITDGDLRRGVLAGKSLDVTLDKIMNPNPIFLSADMNEDAIRSVFRISRLRQIPMVDADRKVVDLRFAEDSSLLDLPPVRVVIMAGGVGRRLWPLTQSTPKPLLKVGDHTLIEGIVHHLANQGLKDITVSIGFSKEKIKDYLDDGSKWGVKVDYLEEEKPLGTFGALGNLKVRSPDEIILTINGDLITSIDYISMIRFHLRQKSEFTVAVRSLNFEIPYGIVEFENDVVSALTEKPVYRFNVNAGIYLLNANLQRKIKPKEYLDATDFIRQSVIPGRHTIRAFMVTEYWMDVGRHEELESVRKDWQKNQKS